MATISPKNDPQRGEIKQKSPFEVERLQLQNRVAKLPASKSISNRALVLNALSGEEGRLENVSDCDDTFVMQRALSQKKDYTEKQAEVCHIDIMAAGTSMRFLTAYLCTREGTWEITGTERMRQRPIRILVDALRRLGACIDYVESEGFPPLRIQGKTLEGGEMTLEGNVSSQYISALLMVGPTLAQGLTLRLTGGIVSRPYIDMTLKMMRDFGAEAAWEGEDCIRVRPTGYRSTPYTIENDWSAASYWYELVALTPGSSAVLPGLFRESMQGDQVVQDIFAQLGVESRFEQGGVVLSHNGQRCTRLDLDMLRCPDLAQTVVVSCCMLNVPFRITGLQSLKIKETDRIHALRTELRKLGYVVNEAEDSILYWEGQRCAEVEQPAIDTYDDHRMAMAFAPCCQVRGCIRINHPEVVSKSYPNFFEAIGATKA
ncbi:MAG: 3-phosphoshikimate 1-carboxyvinyltransferase [Bacteroidales bacterium]|nr:3-phosphoshikimate 1-carboxyvinyltransferase [Candidatus Physcousia equi]